MILYIFDNVGLAKISKCVREFLQKDTKNDPRAHDSKLTRRVKYAHAAELLSELEKRALLKAGGKPSTWFPPGELVEQNDDFLISICAILFDGMQ